MKWKIGNVEIKNQVVFAPMAGVSNISYRQIISRKGHLHCSGEDVLNAGHRNLLGNV